MAEQKITCPKCNHSFALTETVEKNVRAELKAEFDEKTKEIMNEIAEKQTAMDAEIKRENAKLASEKSNIEKEITKRMELSKKSMETAARSAVEVELKSVQQELEESANKLQVAQAKELELRKQQRDLEAAKQEFELATARKLDEEREKIKSDVEDKIGSEHQLKAAEWEHKRLGMEKLIEELRRKSEQGSNQIQGESMELAIEDILRESFPNDSIEPVAKGIKGGDVLQRVSTKTGQPAGSILFEIKRTKNWSDNWPNKLKDDQRAAKAELAVIITTAMPEGIKHIGMNDGVWVTDLQSFPGLAMVLRSSLIELSQARGSAIGKNEKMEVLYAYLSGSEFRGRIEAIVETFSDMKVDLEVEKRAIEKAWSKREKSLTRVLTNTAGMHGDLAGIIGASLQEIPALSLEVKP